ncbi:MAG TPA: serine/threonine-protein kinase [Marmoricola sp.]|nr:serine/threonine-protein kinase [Marmoricola sp.]
MIAGRYSLEAEVGRGGMGVVWRGEDQVLGRAVALKRVGATHGDTSLDLARAEREARLAASLNHPHVVAVFDLVADGDDQWLVMEYVDNITLAQLVRQHGPLSPDAAAKVLCQAADALAAAHRAGIVHRDVKPSNILVTPHGQVKLSDFGIARASADATLTQTGMVTGSPAYLPPEVATGKPATPASDVWALGATLFHALTGRPPYEVHGNLMGALYQIVHEEPPRPPEAGWLRPLLERTMATDPADRWSMAEVRDFLAHGPAKGTSRDDTAETEVVSAATATVPAYSASPVPPEPASIAPVPATAPPERRRRALGPVVLGVGALVVVLLLGWVLLGTDVLGGNDDDPARSPAAEDPTSDASEGASPEPSDEPAAEPSAAAMSAFVEDYLATVTTDPAAAWDRLTPEFQQASGGFGGYRSFWSTIASAEPSDITADPDALTVSYDVAYERTDGSAATDSVTLELVMDDEERYLISGER